MNLDIRESSWLRVVERGGKTFLCHTRTGENVEAPDLGSGQCTLSFSSDGRGVLLYADGAHKLASTMLSKGLCIGRRQNSVVDEVIVQQQGGESLWLDDVLEQLHVRAVASNEHGRKSVMQAYIYSCSAGGARVWWALPAIVYYVFSNLTGAKWIGKHKQSLEQTMLEHGLVPGLLRPSRRSALTSTGISGSALSIEGATLQFWTVPTAGLVSLLLHWHVVPTCGPKGAVDVKELSAHLLDCLVDRICFSGSIKVPLRADGSATLLVTAGVFDVGALLQSGHAGLKFLADRLLTEPSVKGNNVRFRDLLIGLALAIQRPSRFRSLQGTFVVEVLSMAINLMEWHIDISVDEPWWTVASLLDLEPNPTHKRHREMSYAYKSAIASAVRSSSEPISVRGLMGARSVLNHGSVCDHAVSCGSTARRIEKDIVLRELGAARKVFNCGGVLHYSVDGVQASGDHNNIFVAWLPKLNIATVGPPQVFTL
jgi:hypothetical protein